MFPKVHSESLPVRIGEIPVEIVNFTRIDYPKSCGDPNEALPFAVSFQLRSDCRRTKAESTSRYPGTRNDGSNCEGNHGDEVSVPLGFFRSIFGHSSLSGEILRKDHGRSGRIGEFGTGGKVFSGARGGVPPNQVLYDWKKRRGPQHRDDRNRG